MSTDDERPRHPRTRAVLAAGAMLAGLVAGCTPAPREVSTPPVRSQASAPPPAANPAADDAATTDAVRANLGRLPVSFVANQGRWDPRAAWVASGAEATAYFLDGGVRWALAGKEGGFALDQVLLGARQAAPSASVAAPGIVSYFVGETAHPAMPTATELTLKEAWPGVDVVWSGTGGHIEATYHLAPGADPDQVRVAWRGAESVAVTAEGRLGITTPVRSFEEDVPQAFQDVDGRRVPVAVAYDLDGTGTYGFRLGAYDPARPLVIDPTVLVYAGFLGGAGYDVGNAIAVDGAGNAYVTGNTDSTADSFPETIGVFQAAYGGGGGDAFVAKVNPTGSALVYAGFLGGSGGELGYGIAVDGAGNAYVTGSTDSAADSFPVTTGVFQAAHGGGFDAYVAKVNPSGSALVYSGFLGGAGFDGGNAIAVDGAGNAYVTGATRSTAATFPVTTGVFQAAHGGDVDAFVAKVNPSGSALAYAGFLGGSGDERAYGIAADGAGNAYVTGSTTSTAATFPVTTGVFQAAHSGGIDAYVAKVNPAGSALAYAGFLGGSGDDYGLGIAVDGAGNAYVSGSTNSAADTFSETTGVFQAANGGGTDAFVAKVNPTGSALAYAGFMGGAGYDGGNAIAVDGAGNAYVTGSTESTAATFPETTGVFQATNGGGFDAFVAKVNPTGSALAYAGFLGGSDSEYGYGIAVDGAGNAYVTGEVYSTDFPATAGVFQAAFGGDDAFVARIATVLPTPTGVVATATSATRIALTWDPVAGATSYEVERSATSGGPWTGPNVVTTNSYANNGRTPATTYYYRVRAVGDVDPSDYSSVVSATTPALPPPPTAVSATAQGAIRVQLSWVAAVGVNSYEVWHSTTSGGPYVKRATVTGTSYLHTSAVAGTTNYYVVRSVTAAGSSPNSVEAGALTPPMPTAPTNVAAVFNGPARVVVSWDAVAGADAYEVHRSSTPGGPYTKRATVATTSYTDTNVAPSTPYFYVVRTVAVGTTSADSVEAATP